MKDDYKEAGTGAMSLKQGVISDNAMNISEKLQQVKSNVSFRVNSAREMLMGLGEQGAMSPMQRRSEIRSRRLSLVGIGGGSDETKVTPRSSPSPSGRIGEESRTTTQNQMPESDPNTVSADSPLMSEVDRGTKGRAQDRGFGQ